MPIVDNLLKVADEYQEELDFFPNNGTPQDVCLKFIRHIIVPSLNYGAFIDDANQKQKYN